MRAALALLLVAASACAKPQQCKLAAPIQPGPAFLWKAHKGGDVVWLYGTIHDAGMEAVPAVARDAMEKSVRLLTELGDVKPDVDEFRKHARIASGPGIDQQLPTNDWWDLRDTLRGKIKEADLARAKPWYAMSLLTGYMAPSQGPSMDVLLAKRAGELAMPVEYLETWEEQLAALESIVTVDDLREAIQARDTMRCDMTRMLAAYNAGDIVTMEALLVVPRTRDVLLTARNKKWLPQIEKQFAHGGAFVAVGLGHMLGEQGLVKLLQDAGYTVERASQ